MAHLKSFFKKNTLEAGCDEAGRGCLAGPVVAAAVILNPKKRIPELDDSKKLTPTKREHLRNIIENKALAYHVAFIDHQKIDEINILNASFLAMHQAIDHLPLTPELLLIDGNRFPQYQDIPHECIIKGDGKYKAIAAASILAKTYRDEYMLKIHEEYPHFDWHKNKGYPTQHHRNALQKHPLSKYHRKSFHIKEHQTKLDF